MAANLDRRVSRTRITCVPTLTNQQSGQRGTMSEEQIVGTVIPIYVQVPRPSSLASVITYSVGAAGKPMAADTVEFAGGVHYNNHPTSKTIGHWIMGYGYASSGSTCYFADPVGGSSAVPWSGPVAKTFSYSSSSFTSRFLQSNGVAY